MEADPYRTLGVTPDASADEIKRAYRKLARKYHPDVNDGADAERRFKAVNDAYDLLKDAEKRAAFDQYGTAEPEEQRTHDWRSGFEFRHAGPGQDPFSDFFEAFAQGRAADFAGQSGRFAADQHLRLQVSLKEAFKGTTRDVILKQPRVLASGEITLEDRRIAIPVPAGIMPGQFLRLPGQGLVVKEGGQPGDLIVEVIFAAHPIYRVDGKDLYVDLPVAPWEAALGARVILPTPSGDVSLTVPKNSATGRKLRLKGKGLPAAPAGDIYATLKIVNPDATTDEARQVFEDMAKNLAFDPRASMKG